MSEADIWNTLSAVDVSSHIEKKGKLTYLSWAWAWGILMKHYPDATYTFIANDEGMPYRESSLGFICEVHLTVGGITRRMFLPVMDGSNKAMKSEPYTYFVKGYNGKPPVEKRCEAATMTDINKTLMRCLVKAMAMFGLGHYIYAGEDLPDPESIEIGYKKKNEALKDEFFEEVKLIKDGIANDDWAASSEAWFTLSDEMKQSLWVAPSKGGVFTTQEREIIKSKEFRVAYYGDDKKEGEK